MTAADPTASILIIGAEILSGKVTDENGPFLIRALRERGVQLREIRVVDDGEDIIADAVNALRSTSDYLFTTGGIGPTHDDVTIHAVAKALGKEVIRHPDLVERLEKHFGGELSEGRLRLAEVPTGAVLHLREDQFLPTIQAENVFVMPGVPSLMRQSFARISDAISQGRDFHTKTLLLDVSESKIAGHLREVQERMPEVSIGSYPRFGEAGWRVKVTVDSRDRSAVESAFAAIRDGMEDDWVLPADN